MSSENNSSQEQSSFDGPNQYGPPSPPENIEPYQWQYNGSQQQGGGGNEWEYYQRDYGDGGSLSHATFKQSISQFFNKWNDFRGCASRGEFWFAQLFVIPLYFVLTVFLFLFYLLFYASVDTPDNPFSALSIISILIIIAMGVLLLIPELSVTVRRFHDVGLTGWLVLLSFLPVLWFLVPIIALMPSSNISRYKRY